MTDSTSDPGWLDHQDRPEPVEEAPPEDMATYLYLVTATSWEYDDNYYHNNAYEAGIPLHGYFSEADAKDAKRVSMLEMLQDEDELWAYLGSDGYNDLNGKEPEILNNALAIWKDHGPISIKARYEPQTEVMSAPPISVEDWVDERRFVIPRKLPAQFYEFIADALIDRFYSVKKVKVQ